MTAIFAILGAILCGLPFQLMAFLFSRLDESLGRITAIHSAGAGWYVVAVTLGVRFFALIPALRYKDRAVVTTAGSGPQSAQVRTKPSALGQKANVENGKVLTH